MLLHLPHGRTAEHVRDALIHAFAGLPPALARSLTWDQGSEMSRHDEFTRATGIPVYFCDPASPWQRGSNENTNGLLRQYFPKGTDLSLYSAEDLAAVAAELNDRPRKILNRQTPAELSSTPIATHLTPCREEHWNPRPFVWRQGLGMGCWVVRARVAPA